MPNWCFNTLTIQGPKEQVDSIKERLNRPYTKQFENWSIENQKMEIKEYTFSNPVFSFHNIYNHLDDGVSNEDYNRQGEHNKAVMFSGNNWYDWNVRNWGTKWDVAVSNDDKYPNTTLAEYKSEGEDHWVIYTFDTAWSPPVGAMEKLSELVPNCVVTLEWQEEQGFGGEMEFVKGEMTSDHNYGWKCKECGHEEEETPYCDTCEHDMCPKCKYGEPMPDDQAKCEVHREEVTA